MDDERDVGSMAADLARGPSHAVLRSLAAILSVTCSEPPLPDGIIARDAERCKLAQRPEHVELWKYVGRLGRTLLSLLDSLCLVDGQVFVINGASFWLAAPVETWAFIAAYATLSEYCSPTQDATGQVSTSRIIDRIKTFFNAGGKGNLNITSGYIDALLKPPVADGDGTLRRTLSIPIVITIAMDGKSAVDSSRPGDPFYGLRSFVHTAAPNHGWVQLGLWGAASLPALLRGRRNRDASADAGQNYVVVVLPKLGLNGSLHAVAMTRNEEVAVGTKGATGALRCRELDGMLTLKYPCLFAAPANGKSCPTG